MRIFNIKYFKKQLFWYYCYKIYWFVNLRIPLKSKENELNRFTVGITTFMERVDIFCDLLERLIHEFPNDEIIVAINGHHNQKKQELYLLYMTEFCSKFKNVKTIMFKEPQGLSRLWNQIILNSSNNKIFLFNDDLLFYRNIRNIISGSGILDESVALIDDSFSHFLIDRAIIKKVGWFDERFTEIGGEDDDYHIRIEIEDIGLKRYRLNLFRSYKPPMQTNSYGREIVEEERGYSTVNSKFLLNKWEVSDKPFNGAKKIIKSQGNYWKLKEGMETPDFYKTPEKTNGESFK